MLEKPDRRTREALDLDRLLGLMAARARTPLGKDRIAELCPAPEPERVRRAALVTECRARLEQGSGGVSLPGADPRPWLRRVEDGVVRLETAEMRDVRSALEAAEAARSELLGLDAESWPNLTRIGRQFPALDSLLHLFHKTFDPQGEVSDDATQDLRRIRRRLSQLDSEIDSRMVRLLKNFQPYLAEDYVTIRRDRHVLPVRAEHHRKVQGLLHDQSGTGGTWFIEPFEIVDLNNERSATRLEEQQEIDRILRALTAKLRESLPDLKLAVELLGSLDFHEGLARTSSKWGAVSAERSPEARLRLVAARHPLLLEQRETSESVVGLDLDLDESAAGLLVTGPNMGGKTVVLKTVGLVAYLASCGAHVPAGAGTVVGDFEGLWADIGDAQSLERDLSTFAGHLQRLDQMLAAAGPKALFLCDELGTGTDPAEGAALARAFLEGLGRKRARTIATSHLGALKVFAGEESGYRNASMEFDPGSFRPTYRLLLGVPGQSHAIEMARRLHCLGSVLDRAGELLEPDERDAQRMLDELTRLTRAHAEALEESRQARAHAEELSAEMNRRVADWESQREKLSQQAREEARKLVEDAERWVLDLKAAARQQNREAMRDARQKLEARLKWDPASAPGVPARAWAAGERARLTRLGAVVQLLSGPGGDGKLWVSREGLKIQVNSSELEPLEGEAPKPVALRPMDLAGDRAVVHEVDLRGLTADEAGERLDKALDDALLTGVQELRIIHGKGTGALRKRVQELLRASPFVRAQRLGNWNEGGTGVTVVDLGT